jgi:predicted aspartyl protease
VRAFFHVRAHRREHASWAPLLASLALLLGCGGSDGGAPNPHGRATTGTATPAKASFEGDVVFVDAAVNGKAGKLLVDTGSPLNLFGPDRFGVPGGQSRVGSVAVGGLTVLDVPVIGYLPGGGLSDGILGGGTLCQFVTTIDYRAGTVTLGAVPDVAGVESPGITASFSLEGGGRGLFSTGDVVDFPATRIVVDAKIDGVAHSFVVDTGASFAVVRKSLHDTLVRDGRKELPVDVALVSGTAVANAFRLRTLEVAGAVVPSVVAAYPGNDSLLDAVGQEVHHPVDGLVGGTFLREFLLVIDYPGRKMRLARYATREHVRDAFARIGASLVHRPTSTHHYQVDQIFGGTDAQAQGMKVGDFVVSVDDVTLDPLDVEKADLALRGDVGTSHTVVLARAGVDTTITVKTDDLLPLP